jgi:hypothetical protein
MSGPNERRRFLQTSLAAGAAVGLAGNTPPLGGFPVNPAPGEPANRVSPGLVSWQRDFAAACAAARASGKPVMHFQMMGRLDQELC